MLVKITNRNPYDVSFAQIGKIPKNSDVEKDICCRKFEWLKRCDKVEVEVIDMKKRQEAEIKAKEWIEKERAKREKERSKRMEKDKLQEEKGQEKEAEIK